MTYQGNTPGAPGGPATPNPAWNPAPMPAQPETWSVMATTGNLYIARSGSEFAVYDSTRSYGRWPLTNEGYELAGRMYEAHRQSQAHGVAYTATGYQDPARLGLPTDLSRKCRTTHSPARLCRRRLIPL